LKFTTIADNYNLPAENMTQSFAQRWLDKERNCGLADISEGMVRTTADVSGFDSESRRVLKNAGLPGSAAPCLSFRDAATMPRIWEVFAPGGWKEQEKSHLLCFRMLGADGAGNPICVDEETGEVWLLDHEDWFRTRQFVNSSVAKLAECLLLYMGQPDATEFSNAVQAIDACALAEDCFWFYELACLREDGR
jgi:hypothetical protein